MNKDCKYYFPVHIDGDNRGCEAIAKGTAILLNEKKENLHGLCRNIPLDTRLGVDKFVTLDSFMKIPFYIHAYNSLIYRLHLPFKPIVFNPYMAFVKSMPKGSVMISTGGDMMCYGNNYVITTNNYAHSRGIKTILWGCSMGPENLTTEKEETLHNFSLIYARESLSYDFLKSLGLKNVCLFPDPAFILEPETCKLPECFAKADVVGINISNYVLGDFSLETPFGKEVVKMLEYIVKETNLQVLLAPHVLWDFPGDRQDDRQIASVIMEKYGNTGRFSIMDVDNLNYCQIRNIISHCKMFIGGRTHAVISAYSTCVPALALGYSIKSRGIAKDLGLSEKMVVDSKHIRHEGYLLDSFMYMKENESSIRKHLENVMPEYKKRTYGIRDFIKKL